MKLVNIIEQKLPAEIVAYLWEQKKGYSFIRDKNSTESHWMKYFWYKLRKSKSLGRFGMLEIFGIIAMLINPLKLVNSIVEFD